MKRTRFWRLVVSLGVGALLAGISSTAAAPAASALPPNVHPCVFYGICVG